MKKYKEFIHVDVELVNDKNCKRLNGCIPVEFIDSLNSKVVRFENSVSGVSVDIIKQHDTIYISEPYNNETLKNYDRDDFRYNLIQ